MCAITTMVPEGVYTKGSPIVTSHARLSNQFDLGTLAAEVAAAIEEDPAFRSDLERKLTVRLRAKRRETGGSFLSREASREEARYGPSHHLRPSDRIHLGPSFRLLEVLEQEAFGDQSFLSEIRRRLRIRQQVRAGVTDGSFLSEEANRDEARDRACSRLS